MQSKPVGVTIVHLGVGIQDGNTCASYAATVLSALTTYMGPTFRSAEELEAFLRREIPRKVASKRSEFIDRFCGMDVIRRIMGVCNYMLVQKTEHGWEKQVYTVARADGSKFHPRGLSVTQLKVCALERLGVLPVVINLGAHWTCAIMARFGDVWTVYYMDSLGGRMPDEVKKILLEC